MEKKMVLVAVIDKQPHQQVMLRLQLLLIRAARHESGRHRDLKQRLVESCHITRVICTVQKQNWWGLTRGTAILLLVCSMSSLEDYKYELREKPLATLLVFNQQLCTLRCPTHKDPSYSLSLTDFLVDMDMEVKVELVNELDDNLMIEIMRNTVKDATPKDATPKDATPNDKDFWEKLVSDLLNDTVLVEHFIRQEEKIIVDEGRSIFHVLASRGYHATLEQLFERTSDGMPFNMPDGKRNTALHLAVAGGHIDTVKVLLEKGKVGKSLAHWNEKEETVFHVASKNLRNTGPILMALLKHAKDAWHAKEGENETLGLHECLAQKDKEHGRTFFHWLVVNRHYDLALDVLERTTHPKLQEVLQEVATFESEGTDGGKSGGTDGVKSGGTDGVKSGGTDGVTALVMLIKKELSFFQSEIGQSDVKQEVNQLIADRSSKPLERRIAEEWVRLTSTRQTRTRLLVKLVQIVTQVCLKKGNRLPDTFLLHLGNAGLMKALRPLFQVLKTCHEVTSLSGLNVLQFALRHRMPTFIDWFIQARDDDIHYEWTNVIMSKLDNQGRTALHYAAMQAPPQVAHVVGGFATEIQEDYKWFQRIEKIMPPNLVPKRPEHAVMDGNEEQVLKETAWEMFIRLREKKAEKHGESARAMANTIMSLVSAVAFATIFTIPNGMVEDSGKLKNKDVVRFTSFICAYALGLSFAATTIITSLVLYQSTFIVENFLTSIPRLYCLCLSSFFLSLFFMLVAFCCNLQIAFARYDMTKFISLYALILVGPLLIALVYYNSVLPPPPAKENQDL